MVLLYSSEVVEVELEILGGGVRNFCLKNFGKNVERDLLATGLSNVISYSNNGSYVKTNSCWNIVFMKTNDSKRRKYDQESRTLQVKVLVGTSYGN